MNLSKTVKKIFTLFFFLLPIFLFAQDSTEIKSRRQDRKSEKRERISAMIKQEEEGILVYHKQNAFGLQPRTDGYGIFYEIGRMKTPRFTNLYLIEFTEIKHPKEERTQSDGFFNNSYIYGKVNNFYQLKLGFGQQYILGQKGNKNGIAVMGIYQGGLSMGLLRPYYINITEPGVGQRDIKYQSADSTLFLGSAVNGSSGLGKGWDELSLKPGAFVKTSLRFDFGRYNEMVQAVQIGISLEAFSDKIEIMAPNIGNKPGPEAKQLFFQGHIAFLFGRRK